MSAAECIETRRHAALLLCSVERLVAFMVAATDLPEQDLSCLRSGSGLAKRKTFAAWLENRIAYLSELSGPSPYVDRRILRNCGMHKKSVST